MSRAPLDPELVDAALERVGEGVILINAQGEVLTLNRAARALFATLGVHGPDGLREFARSKSTVRERFGIPLTLTSFARHPNTTELVRRVTSVMHGHGR